MAAYVFTTQPQVSASVSLHPKTLKLTSNGNFVTGYISFLDSTPVQEINAPTVAIVEVDGIGITPIPTTHWNLQDKDGDGVDDTLMVKFDRSLVAAVLTPGDRSLTVTGSKLSGPPFSGADTIRAK